MTQRKPQDTDPGAFGHSPTNNTADAETWSDPEVESLDVLITQGSVKTGIAAVDGAGMSCMADVEELFGPRIRVIVDGFDEATGAHVRVDVQLTNREELLKMARRIIDEYDSDVGSEAEPDASVISVAPPSSPD